MKMQGPFYKSIKNFQMALVEHYTKSETFQSVEPCEAAQVAVQPCLESPGGLCPMQAENTTLT